MATLLSYSFGARLLRVCLFLSDTMLRMSSKQGVTWFLLFALMLLLAPSLVAASRQLKGVDDYYQANVETDLPFGLDRFDRWGFQQTIGSYAQVRGWRGGRREQAPELGSALPTSSWARARPRGIGDASRDGAMSPARPK